MSNVKIIYLFILFFAPFFMLSAERSSTSDAPVGYTGENPNLTCRNCHGGSPLNASGGSVVINNLPEAYIPGTKYDFSITINHGLSNRTKWGFAIKAVASGKIVGTFSENNSNAIANLFDGEIGHESAPSTPSSNTYTFDNLSWTAPQNPVASEQNVTFYVVGNAANGFGSSGDFIYTSTKTVTLNTTSVTERSLLPENLKIVTSGNSIVINLSLSRAIPIQPVIYTTAGQKALSLPAKKYTAGNHNINIDGSNLPNGTYILVIQNEGNTISKKFVL
jgi:hypothetical protein